MSVIYSSPANRNSRLNTLLVTAGVLAVISLGVFGALQGGDGSERGDAMDDGLGARVWVDGQSDRMLPPATRRAIPNPEAFQALRGGHGEKRAVYSAM